MLGLAFSALTFIIGDYVVPHSERDAVLLKATFSGGRKLGRTGAWLKERSGSGAEERSHSINVAGIASDGTLEGIRIFEFDGQGRHLSRIGARSARVGADAVWVRTMSRSRAGRRRRSRDSAVQRRAPASRHLALGQHARAAWCRPRCCR